MLNYVTGALLCVQQKCNNSPILIIFVVNNNNDSNNNRISQRSGDARETQFLFQRLSVILQRFNAVLFGESYLAAPDDPDM